VNETAFDSSDDTFTIYSYDHGGNLLKVNLPNNDEIRYTSNALNRRIAKMKNGNYEYKLLYSGQLSPIARLNDEDRVVEEYVYGSRG
jgi:serine/threonine protein kinase HipA of HipAB toxin-antitoxin module